jgi:membrane peptidoglycan carboxypeptidase
VSSKADDFDVRNRDGRDGRGWGHGGNGRYGDRQAPGGRGMPNGGVLSGTVDYDLGYDANGWDTAGFRSPEAGYSDTKDTGHVSSPEPGGGHRRGNGRAGSHARATGTIAAEPPTWAPGPGGPAGPAGPGGPTGPRRRRPAGAKIRGSWWRHWTLRKALGLLLSIIGAFIVLGALAVVMAYESTPVPSEAMAATSYVQSVVYSANGTLIGRFGTTNRQMLTYDQIPPQIIDAVLAAEDRNFWNEGGISLPGTVRAAYMDVRGGDGSLQGGSTITQQFVRNYYQGIGTQQTLSRKIKEIFVAMKIGKEKSKQWILQNYLNTIFLGEGAYGIQAAAETYFGEPVAKLSVAQDAVIAALIQQPSTYPLPQYRAQLVARWNYVLGGMVQMGDLSAKTAATVKFPKLGDNVPQTFGPDVWDPYVMYMIDQELQQVYHLTQSQIYDGGYVIKTSIDDAKMTALYQAVSQNEATIDDSSVPFESYMHVGAVLENPVNGEIDALYPGPGYIGAKYNGTGKVITAKECREIKCEWNMAYQNREQVGSSFKPYILAEAVKQGMNVQTSTLDGYDNVYIPPDNEPTVYPSSTPGNGGHIVNNDDLGENGPYTPQMAMAESINTAYADLWHVVAGVGSPTKVNNIGTMASLFGVDTDAAGITGPDDFQDGYTVALGSASLSVIEQGSMLATIDDNGVYHDPHLITSISQSGVLTPIKITTYPVFSPNPIANAAEDSQVQYAMSEDTAPYGTAPTAGLSNGQEIIAKTGTTETAQSAFFVGAIPSQALTVALFTSDQNGVTTVVNGKQPETLNDLGGNSQGGYGGTWPATIWHTYAENMFVPLGVEKFQTVEFTGAKWDLVPPGLRQVAQPKKKHTAPPVQPTALPTFPNPFPTSTCPPVDWAFCGGNPPGGQNPVGGGNTEAVSATPAAAVAGGFLALPGACLWVRRRMRKRSPGRG